MTELQLIALYFSGAIVTYFVGVLVMAMFSRTDRTQPIEKIDALSMIVAFVMAVFWFVTVPMYAAIFLLGSIANAGIGALGRLRTR